ncbi:hypothetical protein HNQ50_002526 [Silvimonas terrae]|uniref:Uncharacterized protein n=1 Tax=Silvimonas terrae TaxID=300266 RepID=A0A840RHJ3_9NEIS|nr:hypothetical protein [Silvimonas terrae]
MHRSWIPAQGRNDESMGCVLNWLWLWLWLWQLPLRLGLFLTFSPIKAQRRGRGGRRQAPDQLREARRAPKKVTWARHPGYQNAFHTAPQGANTHNNLNQNSHPGFPA